MLKLDKGDLEAIAKHRTNKQKLIKSLAWSSIGLLVLSFLVAVASNFVCCLAWVAYTMTGVVVGLLIVLLVVWEKRRRNILERITKEYNDKAHKA